MGAGEGALAAGLAGGLSVQGVSFAYGAREALRDVGFSVAPGRFCALLGPNGAGKSTLFALLTGLATPARGRIVAAGADLGRAPRAALARMGVVFQQPAIDLDLSVRRNMRYFAALHGLSGREADRRIDAALERLGMRERAHEKARALNGGHRRRMEIARALVHDPSLLLLDEPTAGLDARARAALVAHVHDLAEDGVCVLWATHLTDEVRASDDVVILHRGRVAAAGRADEICAGRPLAETFAALAPAEEAA
ncbi:ABC transporter ATP-binding protein [Oceanicella actignis]|uniref:ABC-2 type transport system ATP-binding protein n=1 Tax=Oceanicella actignis TaxID=1189325 RepID=A0A1M7RRC1_9RHOB|nr:ABC transporter ATP-binding protein [Oceanicella actignis]TYO89560.1 ABC-2 type transport system ATP-binding protein [Oceanicella actignis]SET07902.1 ABC-2 type transport system ATP-binding protein [Oceanicella actignis]SHN48731.1 ABC-2 type transport system ATP-binding protein [Oceanicella actignis]